MADSSFDNKVVVVTGAGRGLGQVIAHAFAAQGARLAVLDLDRAAIEGVADNLRQGGVEALALECDVTDRSLVAEASQAVLDTYGTCDVLVNNAGIVLPGALESMDPDAWDRVVAVNLRGCFLATQAFGSSMLAKGRGAIVSVASTLHIQPIPRGGAYGASKAGIVAFMEQVGVEWGPRGIRANTVSPGLMDSRMGTTERSTDLTRPIVPLRRMGTLEEAAAAVVFLASDSASYINCATLEVDGGISKAAMRDLHASADSLPLGLQGLLAETSHD